MTSYISAQTETQNTKFYIKLTSECFESTSAVLDSDWNPHLKKF